MDNVSHQLARTSRHMPPPTEGRHFRTHGISLTRKVSHKPQARYNTNNSQWYHVIGCMLLIAVAFGMFMNAVCK